LGEYERLSERGEVDLYYGDEAGVALEPNVPYGWQFGDEEVSMPSERGTGINCFGLLTRSNKSWTAVSEKTIDAAFVAEQLERFSFSLSRIDGRRVGQRADSHGQKDARADGSVAKSPIVCVLFADLFATPEYRGNSVAETQIRVAVSGRLRVESAFAICGQTGTFGIWKKPENKVFRLQT